jgi:hypothetical protein
MARGEEWHANDREKNGTRMTRIPAGARIFADLFYLGLVVD